MACPEGYEPDRALFEKNQKLTRLSITEDPEEAVAGADLVTTDVWASMGQEKEYQERKKIFDGYQVNASLFSLAKKDAIFLHCLPAHRGDEVTDEVIESSNSAVWDEAENRLHTQKAIMLVLAGKA